MTATTTSQKANPTAQLMENERARHLTLQERRTRISVRLEAEKQALDAAKEEARRLFGTDDLAALRQEYKKLQEENERRVVEFSMALDAVENALTDIERQINF